MAPRSGFAKYSPVDAAGCYSYPIGALLHDGAPCFAALPAVTNVAAMPRQLELEVQEPRRMIEVHGGPKHHDAGRDGPGHRRPPM
jgi:hypothetical protein